MTENVPLCFRFGNTGLVFVCTGSDSHHWRAGLQEHLRGLLEQGAEPVLGRESDCCY